MLTKQEVLNEAASVCREQARIIMTSAEKRERRDIGVIMAAAAERCAELIESSITLTQDAPVMFPKDVLFLVSSVIRNKSDIDNLLTELQRRKEALSNIKMSETDIQAVREMGAVVADV